MYAQEQRNCWHRETNSVPFIELFTIPVASNNQEAYYKKGKRNNRKSNGQAGSRHGLFIGVN